MTSIVLFAAMDANGDRGLWVTDGTAAGTSELSVAGTYSGGLVPSNFTEFGSEVLFAGYDANDHLNLWVTNGTAAGTSELPVIGVSSGGLDPHDFTVLGSDVLFAGTDTEGNDSLWVTNGTAAGTSELSVAGESAEGLYAAGIYYPDFTVFGSDVLFAGTDTEGGNNLWVTDGTVAGTSELSTEEPLGLLYINSSYPDFTVFGGEVLFDGWDGPHDSLWVTNGTAAGTSELSVAGAYSAGLFFNTEPDFTVLGSEVLFDGEDANGNYGLWVTNGTAAGTSELSVAGASSGGLALAPSNFTVFGSEVLFAGYDANGNYGLWVTNGTAAGTSELSVAGAFSGGLAPGNFTVFASEVLFAGKDANGNYGLWVTNGTAAGTSELSVAGAFSGGLAPENFTVFGGEVLFDGEDANGNFGLWVTNGTAAGTSEISVAGVSLTDPADLTPFYESPAPVSFTVSALGAATEGGPLTFRISIHNPNYAAASTYGIYYGTGDGTASSPDDYTGESGEVIFSSSSATYFDIQVPTQNSNPINGEQTVNFNIYDGNDNFLTQATETITDTAPGTSVSFTVAPLGTAAEGGPLTFRISIHDPNYAAASTYGIYYGTGDGTASSPDDYTSESGELIFSSSSAQYFDIQVPTQNSNPINGEQTVNFNIYDGNDNFLTQATGTITDTAPAALIAVSNGGDTQNTEVLGPLDFTSGLSFSTGWGLQDVSDQVDLTTHTASGSGELTIPLLGTLYAQLTFSINPPSVEGIDVKDTLPGSGIFIGDDVFLTSIEGGVSNIGLQATGPTTFSGSLGFSIGPGDEEFAPLTFTAGVTLQYGQSFTADVTGDIGVYGDGDELGNFDGAATFDWATRAFSVDANLSLLNGAFQGQADFTVNQSGFDISATGSLDIPSSISFFDDTIDVPWPLAGHTLAEGFLQESYSFNAPQSSDYIIVGGEVDVLGADVQAGIKFNFDGTYSFFGPDALSDDASSSIADTIGSVDGAMSAPQTGSDPLSPVYPVAAGTSALFLTADWLSSSDDPTFAVVEPDGSVVQQSDFAAAGIVDVPSLDSSTSQTFAVVSPEQGNWQLSVDDVSTTVTFSAYVATAAPTLAISAPEGESNGSWAFDWTASNLPDSATIAFFASNDDTGFSGVPIGSAQSASDNGTFFWNGSSVSPGYYYVYGVIASGATAPTEAYAQGSSIAVDAAANLSISLTGPVGIASAGGQSVALQVQVENAGNFTATDSFAVLSFPDGFVPEPGQSQLTQDGTSWVLSLGDIAPGDTVDVPVTAIQAEVLNFPNATFQASVGSATNNAASIAAVLTVQLVSTPDTPSGLTLSPASDSGVSGDDITNVPTPTVTGTGDAGDEVTLYDSSTQIGYGLVTDEGTWSITTSVLASGTHPLTATEVDPAQNLSPSSAPLELTIDTTPPTLVHDGSVSAAVGSTVTIPESRLEFDDNLGTAAQETYAILTPPADGTLFDNGQATSSFTQADIDNDLITYREDDTSASSDSFAFEVADFVGDETAIQQFDFQITATQSPPPPPPSGPVVTAGNPTARTAGGSPVTLDSALTISDQETTALAAATIQITGGTFADDGDVLSASTSGTAITASYNSSTETLALTGTDTLSDYQAVLQRVTFTPAAANPTNSGADPTRTVSWTVNDGTSSSLTVMTTVSIASNAPPPPPPTNPAPPVGTTAVIVMNNPNNGDYEIYDVGGNAILAAYLLGQVGAPWSFVGMGTFQAGDVSDMLLRNTSTGGFEAYYINNNNITNAALIGTVGLNWNFAGTGDFDGASSLSELLLRNADSGSFELYQVAGGGVLSGSSVAAVGNNFTVEGFGHFSQSSTTQMMMQGNSGAAAGQLELYTYNPSSAAFAGIDVGDVGSNLTIVGMADLLGNGSTQMVMQQNNGVLWLYTYNPNTNALSGQEVGAVGSNFHVLGFGPLGTSGQDEMLMQDAAGDFEVYQYVASENAFAGTAMGTVGAPWVLDGIVADPATAPAGSQDGATPGTVLGGPTDDPAGGASISQLTQAMAAFAPSAATSAALAPIGQQMSSVTDTATLTPAAQSMLKPPA